jgi:hypothetical protein
MDQPPFDDNGLGAASVRPLFGEWIAAPMAMDLLETGIFTVAGVAGLICSSEQKIRGSSYATP